MRRINKILREIGMILLFVASFVFAFELDRIDKAFFCLAVLWLYIKDEEDDND